MPHTINLFMWGYQTHFRAQLEYRAKSIFKLLGAETEPRILLVGARRRTQEPGHPICVEPEDGPWPLALFEDLPAKVEEAIPTHPSQNMFYGDERAMREKPDRIRQSTIANEVKRALDKADQMAGWQSFCSAAYRRDGLFRAARGGFGQGRRHGVRVGGGGRGRIGGGADRQGARDDGDRLGRRGRQMRASGARYRRLDIEGFERFEGRGIAYWASPLEARQVSGEEVLLVGGGNSAGQAAVYLAEHATRVRILVRRPLVETMSQYLVERIVAVPNIQVIENAAIIALSGEDELERVQWRTPDGEEDEPIRHIFLFIGAEPATEWLSGCGVMLDRGFVATGQSLAPDMLPDRPCWHSRQPAPHETSVPGVFAIGDVRAGSVKRVGAAVGDGAAVVAQLHAHLAAQPVMTATPTAPVPTTPIPAGAGHR